MYEIESFRRILGASLSKQLSSSPPVLSYYATKFQTENQSSVTVMHWILSLHFTCGDCLHTCAVFSNVTKLADCCLWSLQCWSWWCPSAEKRRNSTLMLMLWLAVVKDIIKLGLLIIINVCRLCYFFPFTNTASPMTSGWLSAVFKTWVTYFMRGLIFGIWIINPLCNLFIKTDKNPPLCKCIAMTFGARSAIIAWKTCSSYHAFVLPN